MLCLELPAPDPLPATGREVGIDMGIRVFATLSTGEQLPGAGALRRAEKALLRSQRNVTRKRRGSCRRITPAANSRAHTTACAAYAARTPTAPPASSSTALT